MHPAAAQQRPDVCALLSRAFADEPFWRWITHGRVERRERFAQLATELTAAQGWILVAPAVTCAALVVEAGALPQPPLRALPQLAGLARSTGARHLAVALRELHRIEHLHPPEPHLTLMVLGVDPDHHGLGLGSAALRAVAARADSRGLPLYLETSTPRGRALYLRHGFEDRDRLDLPHGGPPVWTMLRPVAA